jgi:acetyl coenzyme A synthetase (ADP forming)-like protein
MGELAGLFEPRRVAVVGATDREGAVGRAIVENLLAEFDGETVLVNPGRESVLGEACVDSLADAGDVDVAVVVVPAAVAVEVVETAGELGVENVVVITAGFGETGADGAARERQLREAAERHDINLVGPNSLGVMSTPVGLNATFGPSTPPPGGLSFMSQSGAFVTAVLDWAGDQGLGFKDVVSLGNKAVLDETDFLAEWGEDPDTDVVVGYLEGIDDGRAFIDVARETADDTPIVLVKSGRTEAGARAAASHTGTMAGGEAAYEAGLSQAGVLRADSPEELFDYARALAGQPVPDGDRVGVVTNAGGPGVMTTDAVGDSTLSMAALTDATVDRLEDVLPDTAEAFNPVDVIGDAGADRFRAAADAVMADPNVDVGVVLAAPVAVVSFEDLAEVVADVAADHGKPVVACFMGGESTAAAAARLREDGIPTYFDPGRAVRSLDALARYRRVRDREYEPPREFDDVDRERARTVLERAAEQGRTRLGVEAMDLLDAYGVPTPDGEVVDGPQEAVWAAGEFDGPVAMKIVSPDILHKSDIGGVEVGVEQEDVADTYEDLIARARSYQPDATLLGVQVQESVDVDAGTETIVGVNRDPGFGPLVLFGLGGVFVETFEDTSLRVAPVSEPEATAMIDDLQAAPILRGARGRDPADLDAVVETIERVGRLAADFPAILELDVNPLVAGPDGVQAVDLRLTIDTDKL